MEFNLRKTIEKNTIPTENKKDELLHIVSISINEESIHLEVKYSIFNGTEIKTEFGKDDIAVPKFKIFSIDKVYKNNAIGLEVFEEERKTWDTEYKVKSYFGLNREI